MRLLRLLAAHALLWLARRADDALDLLNPNVVRAMLARLALRASRFFANLAETVAPWIRPDHVPPAPDDSPPTLRKLALVLARVKIARWKLALRIFVER